MKRFEDLFEASSAELMAAGARRAEAQASQQRRLKAAKSSVAANQTIKAIKAQSAQDAASTPISKGGALALRTPPAKQRDPKVAAALKNVPVNKKAPPTKAQSQFQQNKDFGTNTQSASSTAASKDTLAAKADRKAALQNKANQLKQQKSQAQDRLSRVRAAVNSMAPKNKISSTQSDASAFGSMMGNIGNAARGAGRAIAAGTGLDKKLEKKKTQVTNKLFGGPRKPGLATGVRSSGSSNAPKKSSDPWANSNKPADPWKNSPPMSSSAKKILNPSVGDAGNKGIRSSNSSFVNKNKPKPITQPTKSSALKLRRDPSMFKTTGSSGSSTGLGQAARKNPELRSKLIKQRMGEEYSNWREEFVFETEKKIPAEKKKTIEPMSGSNEIIINPTVDQLMKEAVLGRYKEDRGGGKKLRPASERIATKKTPAAKPENNEGEGETKSMLITYLKRRGPRKGEATASQVQGWRGSDRTNTNRKGHESHAKTISADFEPQGELVDEANNGGISKTAETKFHKKLDTLVHDTFGKRKEEKAMKENHIAIAMGKELDDEGSMILNQLDQLEMHCKRMREVVKKPTMQVPAWVQSKITIATDYMDSVANYMSSKNEEVEIEEKRGLWDNIHARRKKGLPPKKPGEKGYPKTLDIEEGLAQARKNVGASKCWTGKKVNPNKPTKMKDGTEVPNCEEVDFSEGFVDPEHGETPSGRTPLQNVSDHPRSSVRKKAVKAFKAQMGKEYGGKWNSRSKDPVEESHVPGQPAERLGAVTAIPKDKQDEARERLLAKTKAIRDKNKIKEESEINERNDGPSTPVKMDSHMNRLVPNQGAGRPGNVRLKKPMLQSAGYQPEGELVDEGMTLKQFKTNRKNNERKAATADARKRGHEGSEWHNTGRTYSTGEAQSRRANMSDDDRAARKRAAIDPDDDRDDNNYSADKTKNPKKLRKQKAMGELDKADFDALSFGEFIREYKTAAWQRKEGKNPEGGLNEKGRKSYEEENPDSDLKPPQPEGGPRKRSFCARMGGMPGPMKDENGEPTRKALALRKWKC